MRSVIALWRIVCMAALVCVAAPPAGAQDLRALARLAPSGVSVSPTDAGGARLLLGLSQSVPYRVEYRLDPMRLMIEFREVEWSGFNPDSLSATGPLERLSVGQAREGWSFLALHLSVPQRLVSAEMRPVQNDGSVRLELLTEPVADAEFIARAVQSETGEEAPQVTLSAPTERGRQTGDRPLRVMLDPGHGGFDPGAEADGATEADLMLIFAKELRDLLVREAGYEVLLTREEDVFIPLPERVRLAREAEADVLISFHADALMAGRASGATVYTLSEVASDRASALLAERLDRASLLAGVDLSEQDDTVARSLMDMARVETKPRSERLADMLVLSIGEAVGRMHKRPRLEADFSVLRAPDIPSVLVELGFLSSPEDLANLRSEEWRAKAAAGVLAGLQDWAVADAAEAELIRQ